MSSVYSSFLELITSWQYELNRTVSTSLRNIDSAESLMAVLTILAIAFIYGVIHAAGPGHGCGGQRSRKML